jgi:hypothetical protein
VVLGLWLLLSASVFKLSALRINSLIASKATD